MRLFLLKLTALGMVLQLVYFQYIEPGRAVFLNLWMFQTPFIVISPMRMSRATIKVQIPRVVPFFVRVLIFREKCRIPPVSMHKTVDMQCQPTYNHLKAQAESGSKLACYAFVRESVSAIQTNFVQAQLSIEACSNT